MHITQTISFGVFFIINIGGTRLSVIQELVGRVGVDKSDGIRFGRLKAARRVETRDGLHQPTTWANRRFADQMYLTELNQSKLVGRAGVDKSDRIRFGRLQAARRVETREGLHQPTTWANRRFANQVFQDY